MRWKHKVRFRHLMVNDGTHEGMQAALNRIADELEPNPLFAGFSFAPFRRLPPGDLVFSHADYADRFMEWLYEFCDANAIWVELDLQVSQEDKPCP